MSTIFDIVIGDIADEATEAIVNPANCDLLPGGGACGAIYAAAGPELKRATDRIGRIATGRARVTAGYDLQANLVIHAVGPVWMGGTHDEVAKLNQAYTHALKLANMCGVGSIALPAISTGIYGFPPRLATVNAINVCTRLAGRLDLIRFVCFDAEMASLYRELMNHPSRMAKSN